MLPFLTVLTAKLSTDKKMNESRKCKIGKYNFRQAKIERKNKTNDLQVGCTKKKKKY